MRVADSAKYDFILIIICFFLFVFFGTFRGLRGGVSGLCRLFRKISEAGDFFFLLVEFLMHYETHGRRTTELAYVGSIPTLGFLSKYGWCKAGRLA